MEYSIGSNGHSITVEKGFLDKVEGKVLRKTCQEMFHFIVVKLAHHRKECEEKKERWSVEDYYETVLEDLIEKFVTEESLGEPIIFEYGINRAFNGFVEEYGVEAIENDELSRQLMAFILYDCMKGLKVDDWDTLSWMANKGTTVFFK